MRKITSLTLVISGIIELITSIVLYILPAGRVAYWADYSLMGLSKTQWGDIHITVGTLFLIAAILHIYFNWRPITAYIKNRAKKITIFTTSFNIAFLLSVYVTVGTLYSLPPMNYVLQLGEHFTDSANKKYGEPPYGHAELSTLKMFCSKMNIDTAKAVKKFKDAGIIMESEKETIKDIAKKNKLTPQQLYQIIKPDTKRQGGGKANFPESPPPGFGKKTVSDICQIYNLSKVEALGALHEAGLDAEAGETVKEIAGKNSLTPMSIFEILYDVAGKTP